MHAPIVRSNAEQMWAMTSNLFIPHPNRATTAAPSEQQVSPSPKFDTLKRHQWSEEQIPIIFGSYRYELSFMVGWSAATCSDLIPWANLLPICSGYTQSACQSVSHSALI